MGLPAHLPPCKGYLRPTGDLIGQAPVLSMLLTACFVPSCICMCIECNLWVRRILGSAQFYWCTSSGIQWGAEIVSQFQSCLQFARRIWFHVQKVTRNPPVLPQHVLACSLALIRPPPSIWASHKLSCFLAPVWCWATSMQLAACWLIVYRRISTTRGGIYYTISNMQLWFHFCDVVLMPVDEKTKPPWSSPSCLVLLSTSNAVAWTMFHHP